jgi:predicted nucleic acid-binding protein
VNTYFETSAIVNLGVVEEGSDEAGTLWDASDIAMTSRLSYTEARAALAAAGRADRLSDRELEGGKRGLEDRFQELDLVEVTEEIARSAGDLAEEYGLRAYDAVHLASALEIDPADVVLVTWDRELARAGRAAGFDLAGIRLD